MIDRVTTKFQKLLNDPELLVMPGGFSPLMARMAESVGFKSFHMAGSQISAHVYGYSDVGLLTRDEMARNVHNVASACDLPIFADADTGYGNALNVYHTVQEYVLAGAAGLHIEDQAWPKRAGHMTGKKVVPTVEMVGKIRVAREAREDADFVIIARCDALMVTGLSDTLERGEAYLEAGADVLFFETRNEIDEIEALAERFRGRVPLLYNHSESGKAPLLQAAELEAIGFKIVAFYGHAQLAACRTMREVLDEILRTGNSTAIWERMLPLDDVWQLCDLAKLKELQENLGS